MKWNETPLWKSTAAQVPDFLINHSRVIFSMRDLEQDTLPMWVSVFSLKKKKGGWMTWSLKFHPGRNVHSHRVWSLRGHFFSNMGVFVLLNRNSSTVSVALVEFRLFCNKIYYIKASRKHNWITFDLLTEYSYGFTWVLRIPVFLIRMVNCKLLYISDIHHGEPLMPGKLEINPD